MELVDISDLKSAERMPVGVQVPLVPSSITMQYNLFSIPFFTDEVDLERIQIIDEEQKPTFRSGLNTSLRCNRKISSDTIVYLSEIIGKHIDTLGVPYGSARIEELWRNTYTKADFQDPHIHPFSQWSFIIYETVDKSRTVFLNPYRMRVQTQMSMYDRYFGEDWVPELKQGSIVIFPSFIEHYVLTGGEGSTIAGNVFLSPPLNNDAPL